MEDKEKKVLADEKTTVLMSKVKRERFDISLNPKKYLLEHSQGELKKLEAQEREGLNENEIKLLDQMILNYRENVEKYSVERLEATLVPLKYRDLQSIKDSVLEAVKYSHQFNWDDDIKMRAMIREEHTMTVYLALRKRDNLAERYYATLEDISAETESTIEEIHQHYLDNFVLSEEERKNS